MLSPAVREFIRRSVLCWLATVDTNGWPNVSPKEIFAASGQSQLVIANIASPQSAKNIGSNAPVCVSFVDIFAQRGFKLRGRARIIAKESDQFASLAEPLAAMTKGLFPIQSIILVDVQESRPILAPSYHLIKGTTEESQIKSGMVAYGVQPMQR